MHFEKLEFLEKEFPDLLKKIDPSITPEWGSMNVIQMIEHMSESISLAYGKKKLPFVTPEAIYSRVRAFALSDIPFKPNTKNSFMSEVPAPAKNTNKEEAIKELENELAEFVNYYETNKGAIVQNSFFGDFNFEEWTHLLQKHAKHHLKQFGIIA